MTSAPTHNHSAPKTTARIVAGVAVLLVLLANFSPRYSAPVWTSNADMAFNDPRLILRANLRTSFDTVCPVARV